jgi:hypothetical protein
LIVWIILLLTALLPKVISSGCTDYSNQKKQSQRNNRHVFSFAIIFWLPMTALNVAIRRHVAIRLEAMEVPSLVVVVLLRRLPVLCAVPVPMMLLNVVMQIQPAIISTEQEVTLHHALVVQII